MNVQALANAGAVAALNRATEQWETMKKDLDAILGSSQRLFAAQNAAAARTSGSDKLLSDSRDLFQAFTAFGPLRDKSLLGNMWISLVFGAPSIVAISGPVFSITRPPRLRTAHTTDANNRHKEENIQRKTA